MATKAAPGKSGKKGTSNTHKACTGKCGLNGRKEVRLEGLDYGGDKGACQQKSVPASESAVSPGETLARDAISAIAKSKECKDSANGFYEQNARDFLRVCNDSGNDPIAVVKQVAETYKIDLSADGRFDNTIQRDVRSLLIKVLIRFVVDATSFAASEIAGGNSDWKAILKEYINQRLGGVFKGECRGDGKYLGDKERGLLASGALDTNDLVLRPGTYSIRYPHVVPAIIL